MNYNNDITSETLLQVLRGARSLISKPHGYIKRRMTNGFGGFCLLGALHTALDSARLFNNKAMRQCMEELQREIPESFFAPWEIPESFFAPSLCDRLAYYNDQTDQETVVALFDAAIFRILTGLCQQTVRPRSEPVRPDWSYGLDLALMPDWTVLSIPSKHEKEISLPCLSTL